MNDLENFQAILDRYFGAGSARFDTRTGVTNNIIGALNRADFAPFRAAFLKRCQGLSRRYPAGDPNRTPLLDRLNEMASESKWDGVYAEMVAFHFLNSDQDWLSAPIELSKTVPAADTLAGALGGQNTNYDGFYADFDVCFDVKVLGDKSLDILKGIIAEAKTALGLTNVEITPEYPLDMDFVPFQQNRRALLAELQGALNPNTKPAMLRSAVLQQLSYRLLWGAGVLTAVSTYDPFLHAANHHRLLFKHAKKFSRTQPTFIVFVVFPWFSETPTTNPWSNEIFFRSFCRRFFCQYAKDTNPATTLLSNYQGNETLAQVTQSLTGVLFLEDKSITASNPLDHNINAYAYLNPNATHKISGHFREHLSALGFYRDDFQHDNY